MTSTYTRGGSAEGSGRIHYANGLIFDDDFEAGNLGSVRCVSDLGHGQAEYEISIRPDTNAPRYRLWFYFRVRANPAERGSSSSESSRRVVFTIVNFSKTKSLYRDGMSPLVRSTSRPRWERIPRRSVFFFRSTKHRGGGGSGASAAFVMSFVFSFDRLNSREEYFFAYSYPFTYTEQQRYLARLEAQRLPFVRRELLCRSVQGRRVDVVFIDEDLDGTGRRLAAKSSTCVGVGGGVESNMKRNPGALNGAATDKRMGRTSGSGEPSSMAAEQHRMQHELRRSKPTVVVVGRVHPGETPASFVVKGFLDFITSATDRDAERLRREVSFVVVPMLNPDGTFIGNYRTCSLGIDHNRRWAKPTHAMEPSLIAVKELITRLRANGGVDFFIDVHAHSTARHGFVLCNPPPAAAVRNATEAEQSQRYDTATIHHHHSAMHLLVYCSLLCTRIECYCTCVCMCVCEI